MPKKSPLIPPAHCTTLDYLESLLAVLQTRNFLTRNQAIALRIACSHSLPAKIELHQRTPKGTVYLYINDALTHVINNRAHTKNRVRENP